MVNTENTVTEVNFGIFSTRLNEYETAMLFDTYVENEKEGIIVTRVHIAKNS